jgi:hypothetical protein
MPSNRSEATSGTESRSRRRVLAALGAGAVVSVAGCSDVLSGPGDTEVEPAEVVVENRTAEPAEVAVRLTDGGEETLFSRVFAVGPDELVGRGAVDTTPSRVHAFTPGGVSRRWRYDPDLSADFDCEIKDVGLTLRADDTIDPWYKC